MTEFYKRKPTDKIWWIKDDQIGAMRFSFDRKRTYNLFLDYPKLPRDLKSIFDRENPELVSLLFN